MDEGPGYRWFAWTEDTHIGAGRGWNQDLSRLVKPTATGLTSPRLVESGRQFGDGRGAFYVVGAEAGKPTLKEFTFSGDPQPVVTTRSFPFGEALPKRIAVRHVVQGKLAIAQLLCEEVAGGTTRIVLRTIGPAAGPAAAEPPKVILEHAGRIEAMEIEPRGTATKGAVDVLLAPTSQDKDQRMTYLRVPLAGGQAAKWSFEPPKGQGSPAVEGWCIAPASIEDPPVLAKVKDRLLLSTAGAAAGTDWKLVSEDAAHAIQLRLVAMGSGELWATWIDRSKGIVYLSLSRS
jgi:hypothetical protein